MKLFDQEIDSEFVYSSYKLSITTAVALIILEFLLWDREWAQKFAKKENRSLYLKGVLSNTFHYLVLGPLAYGVVSAWVLSRGEPYPVYIAAPIVFTCQAIGYAKAHAWMHKSGNYWIHKYHHQFSERTFVRPISANSVTPVEFLVAYALPIVVGGMIGRPSIDLMYYVTSAISFTNLFIHTPETVLPMRWTPDWMVTNWKHFHHHEKDVKAYYSAPIFDIDSLLGLKSEIKMKKKPN